MTKHFTIASALTSTLFQIQDKKSKIHFLIDTGAEISVFPKKQFKGFRNVDPVTKLHSASGDEIKTYGHLTLELNIGLNHPILWHFVVADVTQPLIGADFLKDNKLLVDVGNSRLLDSVTMNTVMIETSNVNCETFSSSINKHDPKYAKLLHQHKVITVPEFKPGDPKHGVYHHIETTGRPCYAKARQLTVN